MDNWFFFIEPEFKKILFAVILGLWLSAIIHLTLRDFRF